MTELTPRHVLVDLFGSGDFPAEVLDPVHAAEIVIQRRRDVALRSSRRAFNWELTARAQFGQDLSGVVHMSQRSRR